MVDTPNIRFKGFTEAWEQRKLGDYSELITKGTTPSSFCEDGNVTFVKIEALREKRVIKELCSAISEEIHKGELARSILKENDIVFAIAGATVGKCAIITKNILPANTNQALAIIRLKSSINRDFVYFSLKSKQMKIYINQSKSVGAQPNLSLAQMNAFEFLCPYKKEEQQKIGDYFSTLDNLITLHQRKCDETIELKKYMLLKMFSKEGKKIPEIRFAGFTEAWEQRKLGAIFEEYSEKNHPELPALTIIQGSGTVKREESDRNLMYDKSNLSGYKMVRKDDFIVHLRSFEGGLEKANSNGIISPAYHTFHGDNIDSRFYYPYFRSFEFIKKKLIPHVYGIRDGRSIDIDGMKTIEIPYTSFEEQQTIGTFLDSLDHLITLHQRKCDQLKEVKEFMLQNMFPQKG